MLPSSPGTRQVEDIDLSFFGKSYGRQTPKQYKSPRYRNRNFSSPRRRGQISPAVFDIDMDHAAITGKSTRKKKRKPKLAKKTKQVMLSFLDSSPSPLRLSKRTNELFPPHDNNNMRKLATTNLIRNNRKNQQPNGKARNRRDSQEDEGEDENNTYVPMHAVTNLYRRSEIMEHNIEVGIKLHEYLLSQGLTPSKASKMARPYFLEDFRSKTPPKTFSPFRKSARLLFGHDAVIKTPVNVRKVR